MNISIFNYGIVIKKVFNRLININEVSFLGKSLKLYIYMPFCINFIFNFPIKTKNAKFFLGVKIFK